MIKNIKKNIKTNIKTNGVAPTRGYPVVPVAPSSALPIARASEGHQRRRIGDRHFEFDLTGLDSTSCPDLTSRVLRSSIPCPLPVHGCGRKTEL